MVNFLPASVWSFLRWKRGDPRKLFLMVLKRFLQWAIEGDPGGVDTESGVSAISINASHHCQTKQKLCQCKKKIHSLD